MILLFLSFNLLMASNTFDINLVVFINYILNGQPLGKGRSEWPLEWSDVFPDLGSPDREVTGLHVAVPLSLVKFYGWIVMGQWLIKWLTPGNDPGDIADHDPEFRIIVLGLLCPCQRHALYRVLYSLGILPVAIAIQPRYDDATREPPKISAIVYTRGYNVPR